MYIKGEIDFMSYKFAISSTLVLHTSSEIGHSKVKRQLFILYISYLRLALLHY